MRVMLVWHPGCCRLSPALCSWNLNNRRQVWLRNKFDVIESCIQVQARFFIGAMLETSVFFLFWPEVVEKNALMQVNKDRFDLSMC